MPLAALAALVAATSSPIWHAGNASVTFAYFLSPEFVLPAATTALSTAPLVITALASPNVAGGGTTQSKLLGAFVVLVNGVALTAGPGHCAPDDVQPLRTLDLLPLGLLRDPPATNVLAVRCFFANTWDGAVDAAAVPRLQALLAVTRAGNGTAVPLVGTGGAWDAWDAAPFHRPAGDAVNHSKWYHVPDENLDARARPVGWAAPGFARGPSWTPAEVQPPFPAPLAVDPAPPPAFLSRAACAVTTLPSGATLVDFGQMLMGGPNLTFDGGGGGGATFVVTLGEELQPPAAGGGVVVPARSSVNYTAVWTLDAAAASPRNAGLHAHEFAQFRWAQLSPGAPPLAPGGARAWVVQAARGGAGDNPFELPCAASTPLVPARAPAAPGPHGAFESSSPGLDAVFRLCAYTAVATTLELNVDSQTRQRDLCHVDAAITADAQYAVFPAADPSVARRSARNAFANSSAVWASSFEFKAAAVLMAHGDAIEGGDAGLAADAWAASDAATASDAFPTRYVAAQLLAGARYFDVNTTPGWLVVPPGCGAGAGGWACDPLVDWPESTRDGYVVSPTDAVRNGVGAKALRALADLAGWTGRPAAVAMRYAAMASNISAALRGRLLRRNGSEAYFVDGATGAAAAHAAVHSTVYAVVGGAAGGWAAGGGPPDALLADALAAYLRRRDTGNSSCMTARWYIDALYTLGESSDAAADFALELLSREAYPSWLAMIRLAAATTTLEAWLPGDKWNTDFAHPWCASPAALIPRRLMGLQPLLPAWARFRVAPQPASLAFARVVAPTPRGAVVANFTQDAAGGVALALVVPPGATAAVCLPQLHAAAGGAQGALPLARAVRGDALMVDGVVVSAAPWGRLLCADADVGPGAHTVARRQTE